MKTRTIASTLVALSLGASLTACGGAELSDGSELSGDEIASADDVMSNDFAQVDQEITQCDDQQYDHWRYLSALAVASANELGRWNGAKDFAKQNGSIQLSSEGLARCNNNGGLGCDNIKTILQLQNDETKVIPRHDPGLLKQYMVSFFDRQVTWNQSNPAPDHSLKLASVSADVCGLRYHFNVTGGTTTTSTASTGTTSGTGVFSGTSSMVATHSNKCVDTYQNSTAEYAWTEQDNCSPSATQNFTLENKGGSNYQLKNGAGKCVGIVNSSTAEGANVDMRTCSGAGSQLFTATHKGNNNFEFKNVASGKCLDVRTNSASIQQSGCHGGANQTFKMASVNTGASSSGTTTTTTTTSSTLAPSKLWAQLKFAGEDQNKFLMFQSTATQASIDPMGTMVDGGSKATSGSCSEGATVFDSSLSSAGKCCVVSGKYGKLVQSTFNKKLYYCK